MKDFSADVLICGAGAAGLALAIELARRNVSFLLIEKSPLPFHGSRGKGIQPRTQEVFEDMGILDRVAGAGGPYPPQRMHKADGHVDEPVMEVREREPGEPYVMPLMLPQFLTEAAMRERLAELGHRVRFGCELKGITQNEQGVTADIGETIRVRYLAGTDGGRSFVRGALGIAFPGKTLDVRAVVADLSLSGLSRDAWHRWDAAGPISLCPLIGTDLFQLQGPVPMEGEIDLTREGLSKLIAERTGRTDIAVHSVSWASLYTMNARLAEHYRQDRVFLAGDAAHIHPPTGGQGLNTSIQDSYNLGWKLAAVLRGAPEALLDTYESERRPIAAEMLGLSTRLLEQRGAMRRGRDTQQLDLNYRDSPLSLPATHAQLSRLSPGDRAPDAPCRGAGGQPTRLFHLLRGTHWTLLGYGVSNTPPIAPRQGLRVHTVGDRGDIVDDGSHIRDLYGLVPGAWVLVRPDGYIGAIVSAENAAALDGYLARAGLAAP